LSLDEISHQLSDTTINQLRLITKAITFTNLLNASYNKIRQYSQNSASVTIRLMEVIAVIAAEDFKIIGQRSAPTPCRIDKTQKR
jgi:uncharacterized membrane protein